VLRGGAPNAWSRKNLPKRVEAKVGVAASRLHFLGGVAGWGYPAVGDDHLPVLKVTLHFAGGVNEELLFRNGQEIADYIGQFDVPKSKGLPQWTRRGQIRWHSAEVQGTNVIDRITLESFDNEVAPTLFAITAENGPRSATPANGAAAHKTGSDAAEVLSKAAPGSLRILVVGGGSSHDFQRWFNLQDLEVLRKLPKSLVVYTENTADIADAAPHCDVIYLANNKPIGRPESRQAIFDHVKAGKGLLLVHPALWYNWADWPEYNRQLVGGGSRSHDRYGEFEVTVLSDVQSPVSAGLPASFRITDELYHDVRDDQGIARKVLATGKSPADGRVFPVAWVSQMGKGRLACITLGHDGQAHSHPAYQRLLQQATTWVADCEQAK